MKTVLIGAGNLATNLGKALCRANHEVMQVYSRSEGSASKLAALLHCPYTTELHSVVEGADVYIIAVKDLALSEVAEQLAREHSDRWLVHTAGSIPMDILPTARRGVLYPMQTFSRDREVNFRQIPCFIEAGSEEERRELRSLAESLCDNVYEVSSEERKYLHLSAVFCCNFVNHCYALADMLLKENTGLPFSVMQPLIDETARKLYKLSPKEAQTGPAVRWDTNVMEKQLQLLGSTPELQDIYRILSKSINSLQSQ